MAAVCSDLFEEVTSCCKAVCTPDARRCNTIVWFEYSHVWSIGATAPLHAQHQRYRLPYWCSHTHRLRAWRLRKCTNTLCSIHDAVYNKDQTACLAILRAALDTAVKGERPAQLCRPVDDTHSSSWAWAHMYNLRFIATYRYCCCWCCCWWQVMVRQTLTCFFLCFFFVFSVFPFSQFARNPQDNKCRSAKRNRRAKFFWSQKNKILNFTYFKKQKLILFLFF